ncbi:MAG: sigma factor, partial [Verrucomicrobia bacterium]|nr:sigma factor [Verrucomicrobiota bacterium]
MSNQLESRDRALAERLRQGDPDAFDSIFEHYRRGLMAYVFGMTRNSSVAADIVQDTFLELARHRSGIQPKRSLSG